MSFLARGEWRNLSDTPHDVLLDSLICIPGLLETTDDILSSSRLGKVDVAGIDKFLSFWHAIHVLLTQWYVAYKDQELEGLYECGPLAPESHPYLDAEKPHLYSMFPQYIYFRDTYVAQNMLMYWFGQLVVHTSMVQLYDARKKHGTRLNSDAFPSEYKGVHKTSREKLQKSGDYYATKICQSASSLKGGYGFQIIMVPLWAAQQFYDICQDPRYDWCQTVLRNFGVISGFVSAEELGLLKAAQYPGLTKKGDATNSSST